MFINILMLYILIALAVVFGLGKGAFMIASYNTTSAAEKADYDEKKLLKGMSGRMYILSACFLLTVPDQIINSPALLWIGLALCLFAVIALLYI